jgi:glutamate N-acetyltransferase/amino-acid N-acetyltransferase
MTTDTVPKLAARTCRIDGHDITLVGMAKGSGMIQPDMATMLAFVCTDAGVSPTILKEMLTKGVNHTLNRITIDGDTSTNDSIFLMASGVSGAEIKTPDQVGCFQEVLDDLLLELAKSLVRDGEGATKLAEIRVIGADTDADAYKVAITVANSPLVKTALFGQDANWGRVIAAAGRAGVTFDPEKVSVAFDDVVIVEDGQWTGNRMEDRISKVIQQSEFAITIDLGQGPGTDRVFTCDFSLDYVHINADYRT